MSTTNFVQGTLIESTWLNDVDAHVYDQVPAAHTAANIAVVDAGGKFVATDVEGVLQEIVAGAGGLQYFTEARSIAAPNATVPAHSFTALGTEVDIDAVLAPKGTGAVLANIPDNLTTGGNKRGTYAVDLQTIRGVATQVASGSYSTLVGGASGTASGNYSTTLGGSSNSATGAYSVTIGGLNISSTASNSCAIGGNANSVSGAYASCIGGSGNTVSGAYSSMVGSYRGTTRGLNGRFSHSSTYFSVGVYAQYGRQILLTTTTNADPAVLTTGGTAGSTTVSVLPDGSAYTVAAYVTAYEAATGDSASFRVEGLVKRGVGVATTALVGTPTVTVLAASAGAVTWAATLIADTTLGAAEIQVTGEVLKTIRWVCKFETIENG